MTKLGEQIAVVTGGGRGLGREMALALAKAGAAVAVVARSAEQLAETVALAEEVDGRLIAIQADVTKQQDVQHMVNEVEQRLGPVDLLINNAGISGPCGPVWEIDPDEWWNCMETNVRGPLLCARAVLSGMIARHYGRIINVSSSTALRTFRYNSAYSVSKTALLRFSENMAAEVKEYGISVFAIHPGTVRTQMTESILESAMGRKWMPWFRRIFDEELDISAEPATRLVLTLASGKADALSGRFISVSDDVNELMGRVAEIERDDLHTLRLRT